MKCFMMLRTFHEHTKRTYKGNAGVDIHMVDHGADSLPQFWTLLWHKSRSPLGGGTVQQFKSFYISLWMHL